MATTYTAFGQPEYNLGESSLSSGDDLTVSIPVQFWRNVDGTITHQEANVSVTFPANALIATIDDAITDAIVAHADSAWSWPVPRTQCLFPQLRRGPVI